MRLRRSSLFRLRWRGVQSAASRWRVEACLRCLGRALCVLLFVCEKASVLHTASPPHRSGSMRLASRLYRPLQQSHAAEASRERDPARSLWMLSNKSRDGSKTMKLVLALAGTAAAFVAPGRLQRLVQAVSHLRPYTLRKSPGCRSSGSRLLRAVGGSTDPHDAWPPSRGLHWTGYA